MNWKEATENQSAFFGIKLPTVRPSLRSKGHLTTIQTKFPVQRAAARKNLLMLPEKQLPKQGTKPRYGTRYNQTATWLGDNRPFRVTGVWKTCMPLCGKIVITTTCVVWSEISYRCPPHSLDGTAFIAERLCFSKSLTKSSGLVDNFRGLSAKSRQPAQQRDLFTNL